MSLRDDALSVLTPEGLGLVVEIESHAGREIQFASNPYPASPTDPNPHGPASKVTATTAHLYLRAMPTAGGVIHELLHIHRYWVEGVPQVVPVKNDPDRWSVTAAIENALEHLVIVPREPTYGPIDEDHWNSTARANWSRYPWPEMTDPWVRRKTCLLGRLEAALVSARDVRELIDVCLKSEGLTDQANMFARQIERRLSSKSQAVARVLKAVHIPTSDARLRYLDPKQGVAKDRPIPKAI